MSSTSEFLEILVRSSNLTRKHCRGVLKDRSYIIGWRGTTTCQHVRNKTDKNSFVKIAEPTVHEYVVWLAIQKLEDHNLFVVQNFECLGVTVEIPAEWHSYSPSKAYRDPAMAAMVASAHLACIRSAFQLQTGRAASDFDVYVVWNAGLDYYAKRGFRPSAVAASVRDRATRFARLKIALHKRSQTYPFQSDIRGTISYPVF